MSPSFLSCVASTRAYILRSTAIPSSASAFRTRQQAPNTVEGRKQEGGNGEGGGEGQTLTVCIPYYYCKCLRRRRDNERVGRRALGYTRFGCRRRWPLLHGIIERHIEQASPEGMEPTRTGSGAEPARGRGGYGFIDTACVMTSSGTLFGFFQVDEQVSIMSWTCIPKVCKCDG